MPYVLPAMPLACSIWRVIGLGKNYATPDVSTICNLTPGRRVTKTDIAGLSSTVDYTPSYILLPPLTDIRAAWNSQTEDLVEVPAGSHRFYMVMSVEDLGKGFANEHRQAVIFYQQQGSLLFASGVIPAPVPLP